MPLQINRLYVSINLKCSLLIQQAFGFDAGGGRLNIICWMGNKGKDLAETFCCWVLRPKIYKPLMWGRSIL